MAVNIQKYSLRIVKESGGRYDLDKIINNPASACDICCILKLPGIEY